jgi:hypothetical protein
LGQKVEAMVLAFEDSSTLEDRNIHMGLYLVQAVAVLRIEAI